MRAGIALLLLALLAWAASCLAPDDCTPDVDAWGDVVAGCAEEEK